MQFPLSSIAQTGTAFKLPLESPAPDCAFLAPISVSNRRAAAVPLPPLCKKWGTAKGHFCGNGNGHETQNPT